MLESSVGTKPRKGKEKEPTYGGNASRDGGTVHQDSTYRDRSEIAPEEMNDKDIPSVPRLVGDAVRADGTLKDASEMEWPHSPSEYDGPRLYETSEQRFCGKTKCLDSHLIDDRSGAYRKRKHEATSELDMSDTSASESECEEPRPAKVSSGYCDLGIDFLTLLQACDPPHSNRRFRR